MYMRRYSAESAITSAGVLISSSIFSSSSSPATISTAHSTPLAINVVETAVFMSFMRFAPKNCATTTDPPILQPNANAMNISVIS